jgi:sialidase-1
MRCFTLFFLLFACTSAKAFERTTVFDANEANYALYRIPGIVVAPGGTILAYAEARKVGRSDWGHIDIVLKRSLDGGKTFGPMRIISHRPKDIERNPLAAKQKLGQDGEITCNNAVMIADEQANRTHLIYCIEYMRCFYRFSSDDGDTWSDPREVTNAFTPQQKEYPWKVLATGPGHGIRLDSGRLLIPAWLSTGEGGHAHRPSAVTSLYSDDGAKTWQTGAIITRHPELTNPSETICYQQADGRVVFNIRHEAKPNPARRAITDSPDGSQGWSQIRFDDALPEPVCMASVIRHGKPTERRILFANPYNMQDRARKNLTIQLSEDDGRTWAYRRVLEPGPSAYSDLAVNRDGTIFCFYEDSTKNNNPASTSRLTLARFTLDWVKAK